MLSPLPRNVCEDLDGDEEGVFLVLLLFLNLNFVINALTTRANMVSMAFKWRDREYVLIFIHKPETRMRFVAN